MRKRLLAALGLAAALVVAPLAAAPAFAVGTTLAIDNVTVSESTATADFTVTLTGPTAVPVTVDFATADSTAQAVSDYVSSTGTLTFPASGAATQTQTVSVPIVDDVTYENDELFVVNLSNPSAGDSIVDSQGVGTITNDDPLPTLSIDNVTTAENTAQVFTVTRTGPTDVATVVEYASADGTASSGSDYAAVSGTLTIPAGVATRNITVLLNNDIFPEPNEQYVVNLNSATVSGATITDGQGTGTIVDDDDLPTLSVNNIDVDETDATGTFTISLSTVALAPVTVNYATADGTATAGADYVTAAGTVTFLPGELTKTVDVILSDDSTDEDDETILLNLSTPVSATIADAQGVATIADNDGVPSISISPEVVSTVEGDGSTVTTITYEVTRLAPSGRTITFDIFGVNGTAKQGQDFDAPRTTLTIPPGPGPAFATYVVTIVGDSVHEGVEQFDVAMDSNVNAGLGEVQVAHVTITDDDPAALTPPGALSLTGSAPLPWLAFGGMLLLAGIAFAAVAARRRRLSA